MIERLTQREWSWPLLALLASAAMLATAHGFERFGGLPPCDLCYKQRDVYWAAMGVAASGLILWRIRPTHRFAFALHVLLGLTFAVGAVVAIYHAGGEWELWSLPKTCAGGGDIQIDGNLLERLGQPGPVVGCNEVSWRLLGLSMAGWNALVSILLAVLSFVAGVFVLRRAQRI